jgi:hypothetical protein
MPFRSEKQRRWMWVHIPKTARKWAKEGRNKGLPMRVKRKRRKS